MSSGAVAIAAERPRDQPSALGATWGAFWRSRALVWLAGCLGFACLGTLGQFSGLDPAHVTNGLGPVGNLLVAPAVRWDSVWYLQIAAHGYGSLEPTAFFPLYPLLTRGLSLLTHSLQLAGIAISLASLLAGLLIVRRLAELELGPEAARATVDLMAFTPMAVFFSAVYTEALFLALSAGTFYAARRGRWGIAALLGALASATRLTGLLLVVPVLLLFFYGPRGDRQPVEHAGRWRPRYRSSPQALWVALIPAGAIAFGGYLALRGFGALAPMTAEKVFWARETVTPLHGLIQGTAQAIDQIRFLATGLRSYSAATQSLPQLATLCVSGAALLTTFRRLPLAYGAYAAVSLLLALSTSVPATGLVSLDRYMSVVFPLYMAAGAWSAERNLTRRLVLLSSLMLAFFAVQFATWRFVA